MLLIGELGKIKSSRNYRIESIPLGSSEDGQNHLESPSTNINAKIIFFTVIERCLTLSSVSLMERPASVENVGLGRPLHGGYTAVGLNR
jgi:hypothetical protein